MENLYKTSSIRNSSDSAVAAETTNYSIQLHLNEPPSSPIDSKTLNETFDFDSPDIVAEMRENTHVVQHQKGDNVKKYADDENSSSSSSSFFSSSSSSSDSHLSKQPMLPSSNSSVVDKLLSDKFEEMLTAANSIESDIPVAPIVRVDNRKKSTEISTKPSIVAKSTPLSKSSNIKKKEKPKSNRNEKLIGEIETTITSAPSLIIGNKSIVDVVQCKSSKSMEENFEITKDDYPDEHGNISLQDYSEKRELDGFQESKILDRAERKIEREEELKRKRRRREHKKKKKLKKLKKKKSNRHDETTREKHSTPSVELVKNDRKVTEFFQTIPLPAADANERDATPIDTQHTKLNNSKGRRKRMKVNSNNVVDNEKIVSITTHPSFWHSILYPELSSSPNNIQLEALNKAVGEFEQKCEKFFNQEFPALRFRWIRQADSLIIGEKSTTLGMLGNIYRDVDILNSQTQIHHFSYCEKILCMKMVAWYWITHLRQFVNCYRERYTHYLSTMPSKRVEVMNKMDGRNAEILSIVFREVCNIAIGTDNCALVLNQLQTTYSNSLLHSLV